MRQRATGPGPGQTLKSRSVQCSSVGNAELSCCIIQTLPKHSEATKFSACKDLKAYLITAASLCTYLKLKKIVLCVSEREVESHEYKIWNKFGDLPIKIPEMASYNLL